MENNIKNCLWNSDIPIQIDEKEDFVTVEVEIKEMLEEFNEVNIKLLFDEKEIKNIKIKKELKYEIYE